MSKRYNLILRKTNCEYAIPSDLKIRVKGTENYFCPVTYVCSQQR